VHRVKTR